MKRFFICLLSMSILCSVPAYADNNYNWEKIVQYGQTRWMCYKDNTAACGWNNIDGNWYYFYNNGLMAHDTFVDGYYINSDGVWSNDIPAVVQRAIDVLPNSSWIYHIGDEYDCGIFMRENQNLYEMYNGNSDYWDKPIPNVYGTYLGIGEGGNDYFVDNNGTVYDCPHQGYDSLYEFDSNGNVAIEYKCKNSPY